VLALLQDLPEETDVVVVLRASTAQELVLRDDVVAEVRRRRGARLVELVGPRERVPLDAQSLRRLVTDVEQRDAYICGPDPFTEGLVAALAQAGVPPSHIHFETFTF
jgi:ferredoxin-NADP reductase